MRECGTGGKSGRERKKGRIHIKTEIKLLSD